MYCKKQYVRNGQTTQILEKNDIQMKTLDEVEFVLDTEMAPSEVPSEIDDFRYFIPRARFIVSIIEI